MTDKPKPATAVTVVKPGRYSSEFQATVGIPALDGFLAQLLGSEYIPDTIRFGTYIALGIYTVCRTWLKGKAIA